MTQVTFSGWVTHLFVWDREGIVSEFGTPKDTVISHPCKSYHLSFKCYLPIFDSFLLELCGIHWGAGGQPKSGNQKGMPHRQKSDKPCSRVLNHYKNHAFWGVPWTPWSAFSLLRSKWWLSATARDAHGFGDPGDPGTVELSHWKALHGATVTKEICLAFQTDVDVV